MERLLSSYSLPNAFPVLFTHTGQAIPTLLARLCRSRVLIHRFGPADLLQVSRRGLETQEALGLQWRVGKLYQSCFDHN